MRNLFSKTSLAAVTLAAATMLTPAIAQAGDYRYEKCKDTENAVAGAVVGGSLGAVVGKEIAGRGDNTEGAVLGALIGGTLGAAVGDGVNDCEKYKSRRGYTTTTRGYRTATPVAYHGSHGSHGSYGHRTRGYDDYYGNNRYDRYDRRTARKLRRIDRRLADLRDERKYLKNGYGHYSRKYERRRLKQIDREIQDLKREKKYLKRYANDYRRDYRPTRRGHYHGSNICYSDH